MKRPSPSQLAAIGVAVLLLIVIRTLGEVFRLEYVRGNALTLGEIRPFIVGALAASVALAAALLANWAGQLRLSAIIAASTVVLLIIYKVTVIGWL